MSQLAGHFAGIARVQCSNDDTERLNNALNNLSGNELDISIQNDKGNSANSQLKVLQLSLVGNDRPGIVKELSSALKALELNVCEMNTNVTSAAMSADPLFEAQVSIQAPTNFNRNDLQDKLDDICNQLSVDINLED
ncbi:MAG: glycine cleavage system regulatory protein [Oceanicoccus sp.]|jgi:glycine cleavage system regulatory protein